MGAGIQHSLQENAPCSLSPLERGLDGTPQPVQSPDHEGIPFTQNLLDLSESRALGHRAADPVNDDFLAAGLLQRILLQLQILVMRGDPSISDVHEDLFRW